MNTPAHAIVNLALLGRNKPAHAQFAVLAGSILPDVPMLIFYFVERVVRGTSEHLIWSESYYRPGWQAFIDLFNSLPLMAAGLAIAALAKARWAVLLFLSMALHVAGDLPLHHDDAHRHFFPLSDWRFMSPVSYWDPNHYGRIAGAVEVLAVVICCGLLWRAHQARRERSMVALLAGVYFLYYGYALLVWS